MKKDSTHKEPVYIKFYILLLFLLGIVIWFSIQGSNKQRIKSDIELDNRISKVLSDNKITQGDIVSQYAKEMENRTALWTQYSKTIMIRDLVKLDKFDSDFRSIARSMSLGLNKTLNADGSIAYKFYTASDMVYSNIIFVIVRTSLSDRRK
ncbi:MAG: hypothetical protein LBT79_04240 [Elusimicrobiota bacterium]|jgi:hypothetical protein|nr:hypothetical protein [Elusimicrobiota bacterium]